MGWRGRLILGCVLVVLGLFSWGAIARLVAPTSNTSLTRFDAIIVLGNPVDSDGNPTPEQLARVTEGVRVRTGSSATADPDRGSSAQSIYRGAGDGADGAGAGHP